MKKFLAAAALLTTFAVAAPAMAQPYGHDRSERWEQRGGYGLQGRIDQAYRMVERGERNGSLSRYEVRGFTRGVRDIEQRIDFYGRDGMFDGRERRDVDQRLNRMVDLIQQAQADNHDDHGREYGWRP